MRSGSRVSAQSDASITQSMFQLIIVRPGCTDYDQQARIQGALDIPLSAAGRKDAVAAAEKLRQYTPTAVYFSPCSSAEETAGVLGEALGLKPKAQDRLCNLNQGLWQGMLVEEVRHKQPKVYKQWQEHPETVHPPDGEPLAEAIQRVDDVLEKLTRKHRSGTVVIVTPEPLASIIRHRVEGTELGDLWRATNGCDRLNVLSVEPAVHLANGKKNGKPASATEPKELIYRGAIINRP